VSDEPTNLPGHPDDHARQQTEVDALLKSAAGVGGAGAGAVGALEQSDIDVLLKAGGLASTTADAAAAVSAAQTEFHASPTADSATAQAFTFEPLTNGVTPQVDPKRVSMLGDVNLRVKVQLGQTRMLVEEVLKLGEGSVVELDKLAGDPVDILVNDRLIARGEVLVLNDNFCVRVNEVISNNPHRVTV